MTDDDFPPPKPEAKPETDFSDFDAGAATAGDFTAEDFMPPVPEEATHDEGRMPPPFDLSGIDLLSPPGFVGDVAAWIDSQCMFPRRRLAVAAALSTVGNAGGLRHEDAMSDVTANLLMFCVSASATGKEAVQQAMAELHRSVGIHRAMVGMIKSEKEILENIIEHQAALFVVDEIGIFLTKVDNAQKRGGAAHLEGVNGIIMAVFSKASSRFLLGGREKRELRKQFAAMMAKAEDDGIEPSYPARMLDMVENGLERPFLSLIGFTTPGTFDAVVDGASATQGFVGRAMIVIERDINPEAREGFRRAKGVPVNIAMRMSQLYNGDSFDQSETSPRVEYVGKRTIIKTTPEAESMMAQVSKWFHRYADDMGEATGEASVAMIRRAYEMVGKISFILAIPEGERTADHVRWAFAYVRKDIDGKIALVYANESQRHNPEASLAARITGFMDPDKGTTAAVLANRLKISVDDVQALLDKMQKAGLAKAETGKRKYRGKPVMLWKPVDMT